MSPRHTRKPRRRRPIVDTPQATPPTPDQLARDLVRRGLASRLVIGPTTSNDPLGLFSSERNGRA